MQFGQDNLSEYSEDSSRIDYNSSFDQFSNSQQVVTQNSHQAQFWTTYRIQQGQQPMNGNNEQIYQGQILVQETQNLYKNFARVFQKFIRKTIDKTYYNKTTKNFLREENLGKQKLEKYLQDKQLKQMASEFFNQLGWTRFFLQANRIDIRQYFRTI